MKFEILNDLEICREVWSGMIAPRNFFDLWQVRIAFHRAYNHSLHFVLVSDDFGVPCGLLPLCFAEDVGKYLYFPGEMYNGRTWLEQNKVVAIDSDMLMTMLEFIDGEHDIRYLQLDGRQWMQEYSEIDEINYSFCPASCGYSFERYISSLSSKARYSIVKEAKAFDAEVILDRKEDLDIMFDMNLSNFGSHSYFSDPRFIEGFKNIIRFAEDEGMLNITTVLIGGVVGAVDVGVIYDNNYTILAGGTNPDFRGIAKYINLYHIERACKERYDRVDLLCGDFGWKKRFALTPEPLWQIDTKKVSELSLLAKER